VTGDALDSDDGYDREDDDEAYYGSDDDDSVLVPHVPTRLNQMEANPGPVCGPILENAYVETLEGLRAWKISLAKMFRACPATTNNESNESDAI
jgi:hypothetical protein